MKKILFLFLACISFVTSYSQTKAVERAKLFQSNGITELSIVATYIDENGDEAYTINSTEKINAMGFTIEKITQPGTKFGSVHTYSYLNDSILIKEEKFYKLSNNTSRVEYKYDNLLNLKTEVKYDKNNEQSSTLEYSYLTDSKQISQAVEVNEKHKSSSTSIYEYSLNKLISITKCSKHSSISETTNLETESVTNSKESLIYNLQGKLIERLIYNHKGNVRSKMEYEYSEKSIRSKEYHYSSNNNNFNESLDPKQGSMLLTRIVYYIEIGIISKIELIQNGIATATINYHYG